MSEKPKTHRERAEEAVLKMGAARGWLLPEKVNVVAEGTYPTELVKAAKTLLRLVEGEARDLERLCHQEFATREISEARAALALYQPPGEPGKEG